MTTGTRSTSATKSDLGRQFAAIEGLRLIKNEPLANHTSMGVGGPAKWFLEIDEEGALVKAVGLLRRNQTKWMMLGGGSNTLFSDSGYDGAIIKLGGEFRKFELREVDDIMIAGAAAPLNLLVKHCKKVKRSGLEFCVGIWGNLGGALAGNAGTGGEDICSVTESVRVIDRKSQVRTLRRGEYSFGYRSSELADAVILSAELKLRPETAETIEKKIAAHLAKRHEQPGDRKTAGCMFKNPDGGFAGRLIDRSGLKSLRVGGVSVSAEHANFMVNHGSATTADIRALIDLVRARVKEKTGIELDTEVRIVD